MNYKIVKKGDHDIDDHMFPYLFKVYIFNEYKILDIITIYDRENFTTKRYIKSKEEANILNYLLNENIFTISDISYAEDIDILNCLLNGNISTIFELTTFTCILKSTKKLLLEAI